MVAQTKDDGIKSIPINNSASLNVYSSSRATVPSYEYYSKAKDSPSSLSRHRTLSTSNSYTSVTTPLHHFELSTENKYRRRRRASIDDKTSKPIKFLIDVEETSRVLLAQEDLDGDFQITVNDNGPKVLKVGTANSGGFLKYDIRGTYMLSNLLQELALARDHGRRHIVIDEARLNENPVDRLSRMIRFNFWHGLTRSLDADVLEVICNDPKDRSKNRKSRIYVPYNDEDAYNYYQQVLLERPHLNLLVEKLPKDITPTYVKSINHKPGILSLGLRKTLDPTTGTIKFSGIPFVVPGGRFNEMYGWDSYFEALGLIADGYVQLARDMVDNFVYQIKHYGKILNANRSYYLTRSQPPFLTDMALRVYACLDKNDPESKEWLATALRASIKEYHTVWMSPPRFDPRSGLSRYHPTGIGMPPETESTHFNHVMEPYALALDMDVETFKAKYDDGSIQEPQLDRYFVHDRAVRESGHDTTYRLEKKCADLATVDLNCLLYKYETDIAAAIDEHFHGHFNMVTDEGLTFKGMESIETPQSWIERAEYRRYLIDKYMWNDSKSMYFDYHTEREQPSVYESVTALWTLWAGCVPEDKVERLVHTCLHKFEVTGGLVCGTEESRGVISLDRPNRQWDYPFGWAPHQIMAWQGLQNYGYEEEARRLAYRWLFTITKSFVDFNGVVPEKFDIVSMTHQVKVEYGNVGVDFKFVPREGFGWMNASYQTGLKYITSHMRRALGTLTPPDQFFKNTTLPGSNIYKVPSFNSSSQQQDTRVDMGFPMDGIVDEASHTKFVGSPSFGTDSPSLNYIAEEIEDLDFNDKLPLDNLELPNPIDAPSLNTSLPSVSQLVKVFAEFTQAIPTSSPSSSRHHSQLSLDKIPEDLEENLRLQILDDESALSSDVELNETGNGFSASPNFRPISLENASSSSPSNAKLDKRRHTLNESSKPHKLETKFISVEDGNVVSSPTGRIDPFEAPFYKSHSNHRHHS